MEPVRKNGIVETLEGPKPCPGSQRQSVLRTIEDWCIQRMRIIMRLKSKELTHPALVDNFLASYHPVDICCR